MSTQPASQDQLVGFLDKLAKFRETLDPSEQTILDEVTATALNASEGEVQGFSLRGPNALGGAFNNEALLSRPYYRPYYRAVLDLSGGSV